MASRVVLAALFAALFLPSALARAGDGGRRRRRRRVTVTYRSDKHTALRGSLVVTLPS